MISPPPKRALNRGALIPPGEVPAPFPDSAFVAPDQALDVACHALERRSPAYSARVILVRWQRLLLVAGIVSSLAGLVLLPGPTGVVLVGLLAAFQLWALVFRLLVFRRGARGGRMVRVTDEEARAVPEGQLPTYTVLVPVFRGSRVEELIEVLERIDYPRDKLDIRLLVETGDSGTVAAAEALRPRAHLSVIRVPRADPRTKPKACNYGLLTGRGVLCTVFDAEDRPDPLQLRKAVVALERLGPGYACVQARLGFHGPSRNLLARWSMLEHEIRFGNLIPGLVDASAPVALGGTSSHFRVAALRTAGAWDPWNAAEDADLGVRLCRTGYRVGALDSTTLEEPNPDPINWVRQRSRWYKGQLQTFLVHMRSPRLFAEQAGWRAVADTTVLVAGGPLLGLLNGLFWILPLTWFVPRNPIVAGLFPPLVHHLALLCLLAANLSVIYVNLYAARVMGRPDLLVAALLSPGYWLLAGVAAIKAVVQLIRHSFRREKTIHGFRADPGQQVVAEPHAGILPARERVP